AGSAGMDLATTTTVTLLDSSVRLLPTGIFGPLGGGRSALLLGELSTTVAKLFVLPVVIDEDYTGEIKIMVWPPFSPCTVPGGSHIAQLLFFCFTLVKTESTKSRGAQGFRFTGAPQIWWTQLISEKCPTCKCTLVWQGERVVLTGIVDTGADVTVIS
ncbi:POK9 protein, partial [Ptilonorhynchus violaceus]|nr:POK9 protein [Ptilonorhynchus violaceus]